MNARSALFLIILAGCGSGGVPQAPVAPVVSPTTPPDERIHAGVARQDVPCPQQTPATIVMLTFGQSNAANYLEHSYTSDRVINFYAGKCYIAKDPLMGTYGAKGSLWTVLGDKLLAQGSYDQVIIIPIAVGGTSIAQWQRSTWLEEGMQTPYHITHFLWHQGESDRDAGYGTSTADYTAALIDLIGRSKAAFPDSQVWVSIASRCGDDPPDLDVQAAQRSVVGPGVFQGPNTDIYDKTWRWDGCHLGAAAQELITDEWATLLRP